jgi:hypothetical protein
MAKREAASQRSAKPTKGMLAQSIWFSSTASPELKSLKAVFQKLRSMHEDYMRDEHDDCAFWYRERPNVGLLAAAVWLCGGTSLEEYGFVKTKRRGRCDLWFRIGNTSFGCEAKHLPLILSDKASVHKVCKKLENVERGELEHFTNDKKGNPDKVLALCFVTPIIHGTKLDRRDDYLREFESLKNDPRCTALVWIGVHKGNEPVPGDKKQFFPGTFLAIKEVIRRTR